MYRLAVASYLEKDKKLAVEYVCESLVFSSFSCIC